MSLLDSSGSEISLRHLPEDSDTFSNISNTSFSFQIPQGAISDNLLAEEREDFFRNVRADVVDDISVVEAHPSVFLAGELGKSKTLCGMENHKEGSRREDIKKVMEVSLPKPILGDLDKGEDTLSIISRVERPRPRMNSKLSAVSTSILNIASRSSLDTPLPSISQSQITPASTTQISPSAEALRMEPDEKSSQLDNEQPQERIRKERTDNEDDDNNERKRRNLRSRNVCQNMW